MLCISAAYAVMQCLSVYVYVCISVTFLDHVKTNKRIFKIFSLSGSQANEAILVFPYQTSCHYSNGAPPPNGGVKSDFRPISRLISEMIQYRAIVTMESE